MSDPSWGFLETFLGACLIHNIGEKSKARHRLLLPDPPPERRTLVWSGIDACEEYGVSRSGESPNTQKLGKQVQKD
jgi:hypothetical protein